MTIDNNRQQEDPQTNTSNAVLENLMTRTSIRSYEDKNVEPEKITTILKAAMAAPSAVNKQPWAFVVVTDKEILQQLSTVHRGATPIGRAPLAIVVCGDLHKDLDGGHGEGFWIQDISAVSENILLAAHSLGLGAVWTGSYPREERVKATQQILKLPEHIIPVNVIPMGYPAESPMPKDKWNPEVIHLNNWNIAFEK